MNELGIHHYITICIYWIIKIAVNKHIDVGIIM